MLFVWMGLFRADAGPVPQSVQHQAIGFLEQPYISIHSGGPLCDKSGKHVGMMMIFEVEDRAAAEAFVGGSPFLNAGLYEHHHLYEYVNEAG
jgi:uncharacterized protein YciI